MTKKWILQSVNILAIIATLAVNALANILKFNGQTTGGVSDKFQVYFVPAGYVFAIWGVIYIGLIAFGIFQALPSQRDNPRLNRIGYLFALSCVANILWLFCWHYEKFLLTLLLMLVLLLSLIAIYLRLEIGQVSVSGIEKWMLRIPFSIYLGWISVATIANVTDLLDYLHWTGWGISAVAWTVIMLLAGVIISALMSFLRGDVAYLLVIIWAYIGIAVKQTATPTVANAAWIASVLVVLLLVAGMAYYSHRKTS